MILQKDKISIGSFQILVILFSIGSSILIAPSILAEKAKQDGWLAYLLTIMIGMFFIFLYNRLASQFPTMSFVEYSELVLGKWLGKIVSLLFLSYFFYLAATLIREIGDFFTTNVMVETPIAVIMIMFLLTSLIGVKMGLEVIGRTATIFFPWTIGLIFMLCVLLIPEYLLENILPFFEGGIKPIMQGSYHTLGVPFLELAIFLMIFPNVIEKEKLNRAFYFSTFIGGAILLILVALSLLALGPFIASQQEYPYYILGKKISIGGFLERMEIIVAIIWFFTIYFKLTICFYGLAKGIAQLVEIRSYSLLLFPLAFLILSFSTIIYPNTVYFHQIVNITWVPFSLTICFLLPLVVWIVGKIRNPQIENITKN